MTDSGVVIGLAGFVIASIPAGEFSGANFMKWKNPFRESGAEQNKSARSCAFRTDSDFGIGSERKGLPEIATVRTKQRDIDARD
jgi:hypothetical protein